MRRHIASRVGAEPARRLQTPCCWAAVEKKRRAAGKGRVGTRVALFASIVFGSVQVGRRAAVVVADLKHDEAVTVVRPLSSGEGVTASSDLFARAQSTANRAHAAFARNPTHSFERRFSKAA